MKKEELELLDAQVGQELLDILVLGDPGELLDIAVCLVQGFWDQEDQLDVQDPELVDHVALQG